MIIRTVQDNGALSKVVYAPLRNIFHYYGTVGSLYEKKEERQIV